ncbi:FMN phosphatase YigB (HAD superfamily) [Antricoccus suffuscus]|uniref:FMN phosphatase YigB (HAD superfamily) n=1 Tax=Antricoccus suffuscus TaxID=1629062 RepID=A0A2T0ZW42_9ACTN|nr:HAD family hydrolase [Antricoccus suffuscus]PRZ40543.1 FMN phosphatase YigB (HAD superfamily) [Antricoccus suffuscus]
MQNSNSPDGLAAVDPAAASVLVLDFDGTVCLGDGPVWAYANAAFGRINDVRATHQMRERLTTFLSAGARAAAYKDGYFAVADLAAAHLDADALDAAYAESRQALATLPGDVRAPEGLHDFLDQFDNVARVLVTNAPYDGVTETLATLGLTDVIDAIIADAKKPAGFRDLLPRLRDGRPASHLLSVGDVYDNDIAIPLESGCATAFINRFGHNPGPSHLHGARFEEMYDGIHAWARDPEQFLRSRPLPTPYARQPHPSATAPAKDQP